VGPDPIRIRDRLAPATVALVAAALMSSLAGCLSTGDDPQSLSAPCLAGSDSGAAKSERPALVALFEDNLLVRSTVPGGKVEAERRLGPRAQGGASDDPNLSLPGRLLAPGPGGATVLALVRQPAGMRDAVAVVDATTLRVRCRYPLERGIRYRGLALGSSGRIYAFGNRQAGDPKRLAAALTVIDSADGALVESRIVRAPNDNWFVWWGAISPDERHLALSYHGDSTSGADLFDLSDGTVRRCRSNGCGADYVGEVHGALEAFGRGFLATTGSDMLQGAWDGDVVRRLSVRAAHDHLMDFALDADRSKLYVSSCGLRPGIHRLDLAGNGLSDLPSGHLCGAPLAVFGDRYLALAATRVDDAGVPGVPDRLQLLRLGNTGAGTRVPGSGAPQDAIFVVP